MSKLGKRTWAIIRRVEKRLPWYSISHDLSVGSQDLEAEAVAVDSDLVAEVTEVDLEFTTLISALELWNEVVGYLVPLILGVSNLKQKKVD